MCGVDWFLLHTYFFVCLTSINRRRWTCDKLCKVFEDYDLYAGVVSFHSGLKFDYRMRTLTLLLPTFFLIFCLLFRGCS